jgi:hypothetical protein
MKAKVKKGRRRKTPPQDEEEEKKGDESIESSVRSSRSSKS